LNFGISGKLLGNEDIEGNTISGIEGERLKQPCIKL